MAKEKQVDLDALLLRVDHLVRENGALPRKGDDCAASVHCCAGPPPPGSRSLCRVQSKAPSRGPAARSGERRFRPQEGPRKSAGWVGASPKETTAVSERLVQRGEIAEVVRESGPGFVGAAQALVDPAELDELLRCLVKVEKLVKKARSTKGKGVTVPSRRRGASAGPVDGTGARFVTVFGAAQQRRVGVALAGAGDWTPAARRVRSPFASPICSAPSVRPSTKRSARSSTGPRKGSLRAGAGERHGAPLAGRRGAVSGGAHGDATVVGGRQPRRPRGIES